MYLCKIENTKDKTTTGAYWYASRRAEPSKKAFENKED